MKLRVGVTFALFSVMVGCAVSPQNGGPFASAEPEATMASPARALVWLPPQAGNVVSVLEQRRANGIIQDIVLSGEAAMYGENKITVTAISSTDLPGKYVVPNQADVAQASENDIAQELEDTFPNVKMGLGDTVERNVYGPFGYAVGTQGKVGCMYAWQTLGRAEPRKLFDASTAASQPTSIRIKLCRSGANPMAFVGLVRQMAVGTAAPVAAAPGVAYGSMPLYNAPGYGASDALAASGLGGYNVAGVYGAPVYGAAPSYNAGFGAVPYGQYPGMAQPGVMYGAFPPSAYGTQYAQAVQPKVVRKRVIRYAAKRHIRRHYAARTQPQGESQPALNIPMPDGAGASYSAAPQPSVAVFRPSANSSNASVPMP